jgi:hypothetical protein
MVPDHPSKSEKGNKMRLSIHTASLADIFKLAHSVHNSESRNGSHDDTGCGMKIWRGDEVFCIAPSTHIYSWTSVQNSAYDKSEREDDYANLLEFWREYASPEYPYSRAYNHLARRRVYPREYSPFSQAVFVEGSYHYGSSIRARAVIEVWKPLEHFSYLIMTEDKKWDTLMYDKFIVFHLEHVGGGFGDVSHFLDADPYVIASLVEMDAFKIFKK